MIGSISLSYSTPKQVEAEKASDWTSCTKLNISDHILLPEKGCVPYLCKMTIVYLYKAPVKRKYVTFTNIDLAK